MKRRNFIAATCGINLTCLSIPAFSQESKNMTAKKIELQSAQEFQKTTPYPIGTFNKDYAQYFIGNSYLAKMEADKGGPTNVTFEPGCRNNWHIHHDATQVLICVAGRGWYVEEGKKPVELLPGVVIAIPQGKKHWHGAAKDSWMQHLTYNANVGKNAKTDWLEAVNDKEYSKLD